MHTRSLSQVFSATSWAGGKSACLHDLTARRLGCDIPKKVGMGPFEVLLQRGNVLEPALVLCIPHAVHVVVALLLVEVFVAQRAEQRGLPLAEVGRKVVRNGDGWEDDRLLLSLQLHLHLRVSLPCCCLSSSAPEVWITAPVFELDV